MNYSQAQELIENVLIPILKIRFEDVYPDTFVKCNTRDQDVYKSANGCMYSWYMKIISALHRLDLSPKYSQTQAECINNDHDCIERFFVDFLNNDDNWLSFLVENLTL